MRQPKDESPEECQGSTSELTVEFEVTTPATLTLIVGPNIYNANIELVEETFPLFSAVGSNAVADRVNNRRVPESAT